MMSRMTLARPMLARSALASCAMAVLLLAVHLPARAECALTLQASADITFNPGGGVLIPVRVGVQDAWIQLNMSSGLAMIQPAAVRLLGLRTGHVRTDVNLRANGQPIEREVTLESLIVGNVNFTGWKLYVLPGPERPLQNFQGRPVIGALSATFMNVVDVELDLAARKMNLFKQARCDGEQVYWGGPYTKEYLYVDPTGLLYFPMEIDGKRIETSLNTAGPRARLSESVARRHFSFRRDAAAPQGRAPAGALPIIGARTVELTARQLSMPAVQVSVYDDLERRCELGQSERGSNAIGFRNCFGMVPFELGTDLLRQLRIYIASGERRIYITPNASARPAAVGGARAGAAAPAAAADGPPVPGDDVAQPDPAAQGDDPAGAPPAR